MGLTKSYKHKPSENPRIVGNVNIYICSEAPGKDKTAEMSKSESSISVVSGKSKKDNPKITHAYQGHPNYVYKSQESNSNHEKLMSTTEFNSFNSNDFKAKPRLRRKGLASYGSPQLDESDIWRKNAIEKLSKREINNAQTERRERYSNNRSGDERNLIEQNNRNVVKELKSLCTCVRFANNQSEKKGSGSQCTCCRCFENKLTPSSAKLKSNSSVKVEGNDKVQSKEVNGTENHKLPNTSSTAEGDEKKSIEIKNVKYEKEVNDKENPKSENKLSTSKEDKKKSKEKKNVKNKRNEEKKDASKEGHSFFSKIIDIMRCKKEPPKKEKGNKKEKSSKKDKASQRKKNKRRGKCDPYCTGIDQTSKKNDKSG